MKLALRFLAAAPVSLQTFYTPRARPRLIRMLAWLNDALVLPHVARIREIHLPDEHASRLRSSLTHPCVIVPNHPEFFTDWMLDKWLGSRFDHLSASWADPEIVNGMGAQMRAFWLANNLVAAVRGDALDAAFAYSAHTLANGHPVLIHPEGEVNWDNEALGPLKGGCVQIALRAAAQTGKAALLVPVVWFIRFCEDATPGLQKELDYTQARLGFRSSRLQGPAERMTELYVALLEREASRYGICTGDSALSFLERFDIALQDALTQLSQKWSSQLAVSVADTPLATAKGWIRAARKLRSDAPADLRHHIRTLERMLRLMPARGDSTHLTQEQVAERIKRLRSDWLHGTLRDQVSRFIPRAAAPREVFMRIAEPIEVNVSEDEPAQIERILAILSERMRAAIESARQDGLKRLGPPVRYLNPFLHPAS